MIDALVLSHAVRAAIPSALVRRLLSRSQVNQSINPRIVVGREITNAWRLCESKIVRGGAGRPLPGRPVCCLGGRASHQRRRGRYVRDTSGAALPGVTVTARDVETGFTRTVPTNESGAYRLDFLPTGTYVVEIRCRDSRPSAAAALC